MALPRALPVHQRRQAPQVHRAAAGWNSCRAGIDVPLFPPHPPIKGASPILGEAGKVRDRTIAFSSLGWQGELLKPVDSGACNYVSPYSTKRSARFARIKPPHFATFLPHFCQNLPHHDFSRFASAYLSIYLFLEERNEKEGGKAGAGRSTVSLLRQKVYPRICRCIHTFFVDCKWPETQCWRGLSRFSSPIHTSTGGNALGGAEIAGQEVFHGH